MAIDQDKLVEYLRAAIWGQPSGELNAVERLIDENRRYGRLYDLGYLQNYFLRLEVTLIIMFRVKGQKGQVNTKEVSYFPPSSSSMEMLRFQPIGK
jgi:hypothetical protein